MDQQFDPITLIFLIIAVVIVFRIWSVLGTKSGNEHRGSVIKPDESPSRQQGMAAGDNVIPLPDSPHNQGELHFDKKKEEQEEAIARYAGKSKDLEAGLREIVRYDEDFNPDEFLKGAKVAYESIVEAFAKGDRKTLKALLSPEVYKSFEEAISQRENEGYDLETRFIGISRADIIKVFLEGTVANITIRFVSSAITVTRDKYGEVVNGDPTAIQESVDIWTFSRDTTSPDPNWTLVATGESA